MSDESPYLTILRRVGVVLIVVGVIDVGLMIYCIVHRVGYASSFNVFAIIAGIFLMRGSLRAASLIARFAAFMLTGFIGLVFVWPVFLPPGLALAELRIYPLRFLAFSALFTAVLGLLFWVVRQLRRGAVLEAIARSARKTPSLRGPILVGAALAVIIASITGLSLRSGSAKRAEQIAAGQVGNGYSFHVTSMRAVWTSKGKAISAVVTAWNDHEIREIQVNWDEQ
jgi:hypothetical protein